MASLIIVEIQLFWIMICTVQYCTEIHTNLLEPTAVSFKRDSGVSFKRDSGFMGLGGIRFRYKFGFFWTGFSVSCE